jgi:hypothetical protein
MMHVSKKIIVFIKTVYSKKVAHGDEKLEGRGNARAFN